MDLSIVTTLYRSAPHLAEFHRRLVPVADRVAASWELVLVNDGSPDDSLERARALVAADARVRVVDLSRNFGHHVAAMVGLEHSRGDRVFLLDCDLEESPEWLEDFARRQAETGADLVYGVQARRKGGVVERVSGGLFWRLFNALSTDPVPASSLTVRIATRRFVDALVRHRERSVFLAGLFAITGFEQVALPVVKTDRGASSYTFGRKVSLLVRSLTAFSDRPLVYIFYLGTSIFAVATLAGVALIVRKLAFGGVLLGWASLIVSIWMLGGLTLLSVGVLGVYLSRLFVEAKQRPYAIVRAVYEADAETGTETSPEPAPATPRR